MGKVLIVGGGVVGASCAYFLSRAGWQVTIVEKDEFGKGCSHGNCGLISPSHVLPLAEPGAMRKTWKALFQKNAPFSIKPRFDLGLWSWLLHFALRCNRQDMLEAAHGIHTLLQSSRKLYEELMAGELRDCEWQTRGLLFPFQTQAGMDEYARTDAEMREGFGLGAARLSGAELVRLEPALKSGLAGAFYYENDAHLRPDKLLAAWQRLLKSRGVVIHEHCQVKGFVCRGGRRAVAVRTTTHDLTADVFLLATGAWTPLLSRSLGCRIPIQPGKGYSLTMSRPEICPAIPMMFLEYRVAVTPMTSAYRLGSIMEFAGYDASRDPRRLQLLIDGARPFLHQPLGGTDREPWHGWRPMTYDSKPIIDKSPAMDNVWIAAGHNMLGMSMSPATGKLVAELLTGQPPHIPHAPYALDRFSIW